MGFLSSFFKKTGDRHIKQLVKDSCNHIINASMGAYEQKANPYLIDYALDLLIEDWFYNLMKDKEYANPRDKIRDFMTFYVVRNIGRDIDFLSGEQETMLNEIEGYLPVFARSKDGTEQLININK